MADRTNPEPEWMPEPFRSQDRLDHALEAVASAQEGWKAAIERADRAEARVAALTEALTAFFDDTDADFTNDNIRPGTYAMRFRAAADRLRAATAPPPHTEPERYAPGLPET